MIHDIMVILIVVLASIVIVQSIMIRYLWISPSFMIAGQAAGHIKLWGTFGPRIWGALDVDNLGLVNSLLGTHERPGEDRWNEIMIWVLNHMRADDKALIYGGDEFRLGWLLSGKDRTPITVENWWQHARGFAERLQSLLRAAPYTEAEREALRAATGKPYVTITMALIYSPGWRWHRKAITAAMARVKMAKPKLGTGQRGEILRAVGPWEKV